MRRYETIFILDPDLSEEGRVPVFDRLNDLIPGQGGTLLEMDEWGSKRLAYEIKKRVRGYYVRADYCGSGNVVDEMERFFRIDERVLKYMTVLLDEDADAESLKAEFEKRESEKATAESSKTDTAQAPDEVAVEEAVAESSEIDAAQTPDGESDSVDDDNGKGTKDAAVSGESTDEEVKDETSETENNKEA